MTTDEMKLIKDARDEGNKCFVLALFSLFIVAVCYFTLYPIKVPHEPDEIAVWVVMMIFVVAALILLWHGIMASAIGKTVVLGFRADGTSRLCRITGRVGFCPNTLNGEPSIFRYIVTVPLGGWGRSPGKIYTLDESRSRWVEISIEVSCRGFKAGDHTTLLFTASRLRYFARLDEVTQYLDLALLRPDVSWTMLGMLQALDRAAQEVRDACNQRDENSREITKLEEQVEKLRGSRMRVALAAVNGAEAIRRTRRFGGIPAAADIRINLAKAVLREKTKEGELPDHFMTVPLDRAEQLARPGLGSGRSNLRKKGRRWGTNPAPTSV